MNASEKFRIMVIDDNVTNLNIARTALEKQYEVLLIPSGEKALKMFERVTPDLILLDVDMPGINGFDVIKQIKESKSPVRNVPVIFLTAKDDNSSELVGLDLGAVDYITKPFSFPLLLRRVALQLQLQQYSQNLEKMVEEKTKVISDLQYSIVHVMADMVERRDGSTGGHLIRTQNYLAVLLAEVRAQKIYIDELQKEDDFFIHASQLHDVGKMSIPDSILLKPGKLTPQEFEVMKTHTTLGENAIQYAMGTVQEKQFLEIAASFAGSHHERWDGTGYPRALKGKEIPIEGRLMAIADVYDALISERPYKKPFTHEEAKTIILENSGTHFDPLLVSVFERVSDVFKMIAVANKDEADMQWREDI
ncbi:MAG: HD-GYP domain-containing protein [Lachnospiraceae bacterium]